MAQPWLSINPIQVDFLFAQVLIPAPYWTSYPSMVALTGAKGIIVETDMEDGYLLTSEKLKQHLTDKSRVLILCSPSNPTGAVYPKDRLQVSSPCTLPSLPHQIFKSC